MTVFYLCHCTSVHCGCGANPGGHSSPSPPHGQAYIRLAPATIQKSALDQCQRDHMAPLPITVDTGGWGWPRPPHKTEAEVGVAQTQGGAPQMWPRVVPLSSPAPYFAPTPADRSHHTHRQDSRPVQSRIRPGHSWRERERTTEVSTR